MVPRQHNKRRKEMKRLKEWKAGDIIPFYLTVDLTDYKVNYKKISKRKSLVKGRAIGSVYRSYISPYHP